MTSGPVIKSGMFFHPTFKNETKFTIPAIYDGCSINKLQNRVILSVFQT